MKRRPTAIELEFWLLTALIGGAIVASAWAVVRALISLFA
jgi:hypothetical protein